MDDREISGPFGTMSLTDFVVGGLRGLQNQSASRETLTSLGYGPDNPPVVGETWIYKGEEVTITGGQYWGYDRGICNCWSFEYADGRKGSDYDNNREIFHRK